MRIVFKFGFLTYSSNTLANPRAVMVELFNAVVANRAVGTARRPIEHASVTVLDLKRNPINLYFLNARESQLRSLASSCIHVAAVKGFRLWRMSVSRDDSWISSGCKQQKNQILKEKDVHDFIITTSAMQKEEKLYLHKW